LGGSIRRTGEAELDAKKSKAGASGPWVTNKNGPHKAGRFV